MKAIIYTSNTGSTERYARLLEQTGLPAYSLTEAKEAVPAGEDVLYLGWIMAGSVKGYGAAAKRYRVRALCGVGMWQTGTQADNVLELMQHGGERVGIDQLSAVLDWYNAQKL